MSTLLLILALLLSPPPPEFSARWTGPHTAELRWSSDAAQVCVDRLPASGGSHFLDCYAGSGVLRLPGGGPNDAAYFPAEGDQYCATFDYGERVCAPLLSVVRLSLVAKGGPSYVMALPLILRSARAN